MTKELWGVVLGGVIFLVGYGMGWAAARLQGRR
jgi:hypothetical protein